MSDAVSVTCLPERSSAARLPGTEPLDESAQSGAAGNAAAIAAAPPMKPRRLTVNFDPEKAKGGNAVMNYSPLDLFWARGRSSGGRARDSPAVTAARKAESGFVQRIGDIR